jgi:hypothetical protein
VKIARWWKERKRMKSKSIRYCGKVENLTSDEMKD